MRFQIIAALSFLGIAMADPVPNLKVSPLALLSPLDLEPCEAACLGQELQFLDEGEIVLGHATVGEFCGLGLPVLGPWFKTELAPCGELLCGKCPICPLKADQWWKKTCGFGLKELQA